METATPGVGAEQGGGGCVPDPASAHRLTSCKALGHSPRGSCLPELNTPQLHEVLTGKQDHAALQLAAPLLSAFLFHSNLSCS